MRDDIPVSNKPKNRIRRTGLLKVSRKPSCHQLSKNPSQNVGLLVTCEKLIHLNLFLQVLCCLVMPLLPVSKCLPSEPCLYLLSIVTWYLPYLPTHHLLITRAKQPNVIQHLCKEPSNVGSSTETKEIDICFTQ